DAPGVGNPARHTEALVVLGLALIGILAHEVEVEILLRHEPCAPGRDAARAIIEGTHDAAAFRVFACLHTRMPRNGAGKMHLCRKRRDATVIGAVAHDLPFAIVTARDLD